MVACWTWLFCTILLVQQGFGAVNFLHHYFNPLPPTTHNVHNIRSGRYCRPNYSNMETLSASNIEHIHNELLDIIKERYGHPETSEALANLITKAAGTVSELMADGNSSKLLLVAGKTGRLFTQTTTSFAKLLNTVDELFTPHSDRFNEDLLDAKLKLIETTKETLGEFLKDITTAADFPLSDNEEESKEILHAEEILIDKTKEAYQIIYDSTENILQELMHSDSVSSPVKKLIATKVLTSASNNLKSFAALRRKIYDALSNVADKKGTGMWDSSELESFKDQLKHELDSITWNNDDDVDDDDTTASEDNEEINNDDIHLTPEEQKELEQLLEGNDHNEFI